MNSLPNGSVLRLPLVNLKRTFIPGITPAFGEVLKESAEVCFAKNEHAHNVSLNVRDINADFRIIWETPSDQCMRCHNDLEVATEYGAYGIAILLASKVLNQTVLRRSKKRTGFDFWLGPNEPKSKDILKETSAIEVSGILNGDEGKLKARLKQKKEQSSISKDKIRVYVVVVEFGRPAARMVHNG